MASRPRIHHSSGLPVQCPLSSIKLHDFFIQSFIFAHLTNSLIPLEKMLDSRYPQHYRRAPSSTASSPWQQPRLVLPFFLLAAVALLSLLAVSWNNSLPSTSATRRTRQIYTGPRITVYSANVQHAVSAMQRRTMADSPAVSQHVFMDSSQQYDYLQTHVCVAGVAERHEEFTNNQLHHFALELWKYCALYNTGGLYLDAESPMLTSVEDLVLKQSNIAVWGDSSFTQTLHGSLLLLREPKSPVANNMLQVLMETPLETLDATPLLIPRALFDLVQAQVPATLSVGGNANDWWLLSLQCSIDPLRTQGQDLISSWRPDTLRLTYHCPIQSGYCCHVADPKSHDVVLMTRHPLLPFQVLPPLDKLPRPYNAEAGHFNHDEIPFIATIQEKVLPKPQEAPLTPNFFDILVQNDCLPADFACSNCLRKKTGATCETCKKECACYCKTLCKVPVEEKRVSKEWTVLPPLYSRDPARIVPRIIHQTWFEDVTAEKYPNMSRLIESFKASGWEYQFYTDDVAQNFLSTHFPLEVREAYDALRPGAFKADLFRYCVLLIHGGVYADMDVMLESNLDAAVAPDIGFMVPIDEPGKPVGHRMCLWNGLIAAAPGHPYLAKVIETVVNNVRNRFTSVDVDNMFCPNPELSVLHAFDTLFTAGPCILGASLNTVLGRHGQTQFEAGEIDPWAEKRKEAAEKGTEFVIGIDDQPDLRIPGRTVILKQDKWDVSIIIWRATDVVSMFR